MKCDRGGGRLRLVHLDGWNGFDDDEDTAAVDGPGFWQLAVALTLLRQDIKIFESSY